MPMETMEKSKEIVEKKTDQEKSWAERNGGLIFLLIVSEFLTLLVLYEASFTSE